MSNPVPGIPGAYDGMPAPDAGKPTPPYPVPGVPGAYDNMDHGGYDTGGSGSDITTQPLSVTENGTYTAPTGEAYTPVEVDVPIPTYQAWEGGSY